MIGLRKIYNLYLSKDKELARHLRSIIGFVPNNLRLFKLAFSHKSMNNERAAGDHNNERLEFLGDAILSTVVAEYLFKKYPKRDEGFLTKMRSKIVKRATLNLIADKMGLDMILTKYSQGKMSKSMMGNALEALIGAIYLEFGYRRTKNYIIKKLLRKYLDIHELESRDDNHKSKLLEWCQKHNKDVKFELKSRYKFEKRDRFIVAVVMNGKEIATAEDFNKKSAEQAASKKSVIKLKIEQTPV